MGESTVRDDLVPTDLEKAIVRAMAGGVEWVSLGAPVLADVDRIVTALDPIADGALTVAAQPDVPRNLTMTIVDANDSTSGVCTVIGKNFANEVIQEVFPFSAAGASVGSLLFAQVTSAVVSAEAGAASGDTISLGVGDKIALPKQIQTVSAIKLATFGAVPVTLDATGITPTSYVDYGTTGTYDGSAELKVAFRPTAPAA